MRTLHDEVRVVYRALRRIHGIEKTQDEALRIFKIVYPEEYRLENEEIHPFVPVAVITAMADVINSWQPEKRLNDLCKKVVAILDGNSQDKSWTREKLIEFYKDITPVAMRIRKLTPSECFTLMGVDREDIKTIQSAGISKSKQYMLAGNSIVVDVLYYLFYKLFISTTPDYKPGEQMLLF